MTGDEIRAACPSRRAAPGPRWSWHRGTESGPALACPSRRASRRRACDPPWPSGPAPEAPQKPQDARNRRRSPLGCTDAENRS
ncbi:hypothetical protein [Richelia intracellularis]|uniref:hypothetical protein n=1 Tax=Richelia intracellularis TaxID=1164990 RepID=UPI0005C7A805|nr:hypothetical protein [Richelia intracellularis]